MLTSMIKKNKGKLEIQIVKLVDNTTYNFTETKSKDYVQGTINKMTSIGPEEIEMCRVLLIKEMQKIVKYVIPQKHLMPKWFNDH